MLIQSEMYAGLVDAYTATGMSGSVFNRFRKLAICRNMQAEECMDLFSCFEVRRVAAGEVIYDTDTALGHTMHLIVDGTVNVRVAGRRSEAVCNQLQAGDVFGLISPLHRERVQPVLLTAESDLTVLSINREYFKLITVECPQLGNQLLRFNRTLAGHGVH